MFGIKAILNYVESIEKVQNHQCAKLEKAIFTLSELNDNIVRLIERLDEMNPEPKKPVRKKKI